MKTCSRCLYSTIHPFGLIIDADGVCSGCRTHEEKTSLSWDERESLFENVLSYALKKRSRNQNYDCVVPLRGTPEYFYLLDLLINRFGLRVLGVKYNSHFNSHLGIANIARMREVFDLDFIESTPNPLVYKKLVRESILRLGSTRWPFIAGETQFPVQVAVEKNIPLVVWPVHQPTEQVGAHSYLEAPEMSRLSRHSFDLMNVEATDMVRPESLVNNFDIQDLEYPLDRLISKRGVRGIYLANYFPWDSRNYAEFAVENLGALAGKNIRTFDTYDRIDDVVYMTVHDLLKFAKFGYSRVTDSLCREIRFGRISRSDAEIVEKLYQQEFPTEEVAAFARWLDSNTQGIDWIMKFKQHGVRFLQGDNSNQVPQNLNRTCVDFIRGFRSNSAPVHQEPGFITIGKGLNLNENI